MRQTNSRDGFTLIEVLVAAMLLGMLVTILTMVFNQSAIAWRTGKAGVAQLSETRHYLAAAQNRADNLLPRVDASSRSAVGRVLGAWDSSGAVRTRALGQMDTANAHFSVPSFASYVSAGNGSRVQPWAEVTGLQSIRAGKSRNFVVGVWSYGPDGKPNTDDDITSWPGDVQ